MSLHSSSSSVECSSLTICLLWEPACWYIHQVPSDGALTRSCVQIQDSFFVTTLCLKGYVSIYCRLTGFQDHYTLLVLHTLLCLYKDSPLYYSTHWIYYTKLSCLLSVSLFFLSLSPYSQQCPYSCMQFHFVPQM